MKKLKKFLDLPLVQRFPGNRWAIGAACALMVVTGVVAAMLTSGGTGTVSDAKSAVQDSAAEAAKPEEQPGKGTGTQAGGGQSASGDDHRSPRRFFGGRHGVATSFDNGTVFVGGAVAPGTYTTQGSDGSSSGCRWARLTDNEGELVPIISGSTSGPTRLTVHYGEYVRSTGCQTWSRDDSAPPHHTK